LGAPVFFGDLGATGIFENWWERDTGRDLCGYWLGGEKKELQGQAVQARYK